MMYRADALVGSGLAFAFVVLSGPTRLSSEPIQSFRCAGTLINRGELALRVQRECGKPTNITNYRRATFVHTLFVPRGRHRELVARFTELHPDAGAEYRIARQALDDPDHSHDWLLRARYGRDDSYRYGPVTVRRHWWRRPVTLIAVPEAQWVCRHTEENLSEWIYNLGSTQFLRVLHFRNGRLAKIEFPGYGW